MQTAIRPSRLFLRKSASCRPAARPLPLRAAQPPSKEDEAPSEDELARFAGELLSSDPIASAHLTRVASAAMRVAELQAQQEEYARAIAELNESNPEAKPAGPYVPQLPTSVVAQIETTLSEASRAEAELQAAEAARNKLANDADILEERIRSAVAGLAAAAAGTIAYLPYSLNVDGTGARGVLGVVFVLAGTGLFGVTYRYLAGSNNAKLKQGSVGAFALVRGLAMVEEKLAGPAMNGGVGIDNALLSDCAFAVTESFIVFLAAAAAVDFALAKGWTASGRLDRMDQ